MALQGDLQHVDLSSLVQAICTEKRRVGLVVRRRDQEGAVYFEDGRIVHVALGSLQGKEAIFELLAWQEGTFWLSMDSAPPTVNISGTWKHLLSEGMQRIESREKQAAPAVVEGRARSHTGRDASDTGGDEARVRDLIGLLCRLEQQVANLGRHQVQCQPLLALAKIVDLVNELVAVAEARMARGDDRARLDHALAKVIDRAPMARLLGVEGNRLQIGVVQRLYTGWENDQDEQRNLFRQICRGAVHLTEYYLALLSEGFRERETHHRWRETAKVFVRDLSGAMARVVV
jgi:hypothetical protein